MIDSPVRLICFDLGGVLVRLVRGGWAGASQHVGLPLPDLDPAHWQKHVDLLTRFELGAVDERGYLREMPACLPGVDPASVLAAFDAWLLGMYDGAEPLIDELKGRGFKTACLSNTNARHWRTVIRGDARYAPLAKLDYLVASHEVRAAKPAGAAYRAAESATGFRGREILFFDDRAENVEGARAAGWQAELIDRVEDAPGQMWDILQSRGIL